MPIVVIASQKGGSGKTTLATSLAEALEAGGDRTLLIDADPQRSALSWAAQGDPAHTPAAIGADSATLSRRHLAAIAAAFQWVIIDCPPRIDATTAAALAVADLIIVPIRPTPIDLAALPAMLRALSETSTPARAVITQRPSRSSVADTAPEAIRASGIGLFSTSLGFRADYSCAYAYGQGVTRYAPRSTAAVELRDLLAEIRTLISSQEKS